MKPLSFLFARDPRVYSGVRRINVYLLRVLYLLIFAVVGRDSWSVLLEGTVANDMEGVVWSLWAAYGVVAAIGLLRPLAMLPVVFLEILYKVIWLGFFAYPAWASGSLIGSGYEELTGVFIWVLLPIVAVPWGYSFRTYILGIRSPA